MENVQQQQKLSSHKSKAQLLGGNGKKQEMGRTVQQKYHKFDPRSMMPGQNALGRQGGTIQQSSSKLPELTGGPQGYQVNGRTADAMRVQLANANSTSKLIEGNHDGQFTMTLEAGSGQGEVATELVPPAFGMQQAGASLQYEACPTALPNSGNAMSSILHIKDQKGQQPSSQASSGAHSNPRSTHIHFVQIRRPRPKDRLRSNQKEKDLTNNISFANINSSQQPVPTGFPRLEKGRKRSIQDIQQEQILHGQNDSQVSQINFANMAPHYRQVLSRDSYLIPKKQDHPQFSFVDPSTYFPIHDSAQPPQQTFFKMNQQRIMQQYRLQRFKDMRAGNLVFNATPQKQSTNVHLLVSSLHSSQSKPPESCYGGTAMPPAQAPHTIITVSDSGRHRPENTGSQLHQHYRSFEQPPPLLAMQRASGKQVRSEFTTAAEEKGIALRDRQVAVGEEEGGGESGGKQHQGLNSMERRVRAGGQSGDARQDGLENRQNSAGIFIENQVGGGRNSPFRGKKVFQTTDNDENRTRSLNPPPNSNCRPLQAHQLTSTLQHSIKLEERRPEHQRLSQRSSQQMTSKAEYRVESITLEGVPRGPGAMKTFDAEALERRDSKSSRSEQQQRKAEDLSPDKRDLLSISESLDQQITANSQKPSRNSKRGFGLSRTVDKSKAELNSKTLAANKMLPLASQSQSPIITEHKKVKVATPLTRSQCEEKLLDSIDKDGRGDSVSKDGRHSGSGAIGGTGPRKNFENGSVTAFQEQEADQISQFRDHELLEDEGEHQHRPEDLVEDLFDTEDVDEEEDDDDELDPQAVEMLTQLSNMEDRSFAKVAQELKKSAIRAEEKAARSKDIVINPHIQRVIQNSEKRIKGYCGGLKYKILKESAFINKCEMVNRMLQYDLTDRIKRDQIRAQQAPPLSYNFAIYPANIKNTLSALLQTQVKADDQHYTSIAKKRMYSVQKQPYGQILPSHPLQNPKLLHRLNESFLEPFDIQKLQELTKDIQIVDQMEVLLNKKVRKRQLTGASIRDCFQIENVYSMWRTLHSSAPMFQRQSQQTGYCRTPDKTRDLRANESHSRLQRTTQKSMNKSLTKSNERGPRSSLLLFKDEPLTQVQLQKHQQKHIAATGTICKPYLQFQKSRLWTIFDLTKKVRDVDPCQVSQNYPDIFLYQSIYLTEHKEPFKTVIQRLPELEFKKFLKLHRWKFSLLNDINVVVDSDHLIQKGHMNETILTLSTDLRELDQHQHSKQNSKHQSSSITKDGGQHSSSTQATSVAYNRRYREGPRDSNSQPRQRGGAADQNPPQPPEAPKSTLVRRDKDLQNILMGKQQFNTPSTLTNNGRNANMRRDEKPSGSKSQIMPFNNKSSQKQLLDARVIEDNRISHERALKTSMKDLQIEKVATDKAEEKQKMGPNKSQGGRKGFALKSSEPQQNGARADKAQMLVISSKIDQMNSEVLDQSFDALESPQMLDKIKIKQRKGGGGEIDGGPKNGRKVPVFNPQLQASFQRHYRQQEMQQGLNPQCKVRGMMTNYSGQTHGPQGQKYSQHHAGKAEKSQQIGQELVRINELQEQIEYEEEKLNQMVAVTIDTKESNLLKIAQTYRHAKKDKIQMNSQYRPDRQQQLVSVSPVHMNQYIMHGQNEDQLHSIEPYRRTNNFGSFVERSKKAKAKNSNNHHHQGPAYKLAPAVDSHMGLSSDRIHRARGQPHGGTHSGNHTLYQIQLSHPGQKPQYFNDQRLQERISGSSFLDYR